MRGEPRANFVFDILYGTKLTQEMWDKWRERFDARIKKRMNCPEKSYPRMISIVQHRFCLDGKLLKSYKELGVEFNVCEERVRQIAGKACRTLVALKEQDERE